MKINSLRWSAGDGCLDLSLAEVGPAEVGVVIDAVRAAMEGVPGERAEREPGDDADPLAFPPPDAPPRRVALAVARGGNGAGAATQIAPPLPLGEEVDPVAKELPSPPLGEREAATLPDLASVRNATGLREVIAALLPLGFTTAEDYVRAVVELRRRGVPVLQRTRPLVEKTLRVLNVAGAVEYASADEAERVADDLTRRYGSVDGAA